MGVQDAVVDLFGVANNYIMLICYIVYLLLGLCMITMGMVYAGSTGSVGTTGLWLLILGLFFLVLGCVALIGWKMEQGLILLVVESVNIALYFILFILIVTALMLGSGAKDPVQRFFDDHWEETLKPAVQPNSYYLKCKNADNTECVKFDGEMGTKTCLSKFEKGDDGVKGAMMQNCTMLGDNEGSDCTGLVDQCFKCEAQCKAQFVQEMKDHNIPACIVTLLVCMYLIAIVVLHSVARNGLYTTDDDDSLLCCKQMGIVGWVLILVNVGLAIFGAAIMLTGTVFLENGDDTFLFKAVILSCGLAVLAIPVIQIFFIATHNTPNYILDILITVMFFVLMLVAMFLAFMSGFLVKDVNTLYDSNYNEYRGELELYDAEYCSLNEADCLAVTEDTASASQAVKVYPIKKEDVEKKPDDMTPIDRDELWKNQHQALQTIRFRNIPPSSFLHSCDSSDLCIFCKPAADALKSAGFTFNLATIRGSGRSGKFNETLDSAKENVERWTEILFNTTRDNSNALKKLAKCENILMKMAGNTDPGFSHLWNSYPNPAQACNPKQGEGINFEMKSGTGELRRPMVTRDNRKTNESMDSG